MRRRATSALSATTAALLGASLLGALPAQAVESEERPAAPTAQPQGNVIESPSAARPAPRIDQRVAVVEEATTWGVVDPLPAPQDVPRDLGGVSGSSEGRYMWGKSVGGGTVVEKLNASPRQRVVAEGPNVSWLYQVLREGPQVTAFDDPNVTIVDAVWLPRANSTAILARIAAPNSGSETRIGDVTIPAPRDVGGRVGDRAAIITVGTNGVIGYVLYSGYGPGCQGTGRSCSFTPSAISVSGGKMFVAGQARGNVTFGGLTAPAGNGRGLIAQTALFTLATGAPTWADYVGAGEDHRSLFFKFDGSSMKASAGNTDRAWFAGEYLGEGASFIEPLPNPGDSGRGAYVAATSTWGGLRPGQSSWVLPIVSSGDVSITDVVGAPTSNSEYGIVAGTFSGDLTIGSGAGARTVSSSGSAPFVARISASGSVEWITAGKTNGALGDRANLTAVGVVSATIFLGGTISNKASFGTWNVSSSDGGDLARSQPGVFAAELLTRDGKWRVAAASDRTVSARPVTPTGVLNWTFEDLASTTLVGTSRGTTAIAGTTFGNDDECAPGVGCVPFGFNLRLGSVFNEAFVPLPPVNVTASGIDGGLVFEMEPPANADEVPPLGGYQVTVREPGGPTRGACRAPAGVGDAAEFTVFPIASCTLTGLTNDRLYEYDVYTLGPVGPSGSAVRSVPTPTYQAKPTAADPSPPRDVTVFVLPDSRVFDVEWDAPEVDGGSAIVSYTVSARPLAGGSTLTCTTSERTCNITEVPVGSYEVSVIATNREGQASAPGYHGGSVGMEGPPGPVADLAVYPSDGRVTVVWLPPLNDGGTEIIDYTAVASTGQQCVSQAPFNSCRIEGLTNGVSVTVTVTARNDFEIGEPRTSGPVTPFAAPNPPRNVAVNDAVNEGVTVSWEAPEDNGEVILSYRVNVLPGGGTCTVDAPGLSCRVNGLLNGGVYLARVYAVSARGDSVPTQTGVFTVVGPSDPPDDVAVEPGPLSLNVSWTEPFNTGGAEVIRYVATAEPGGSACEAAAGQNVCTITDLTNDRDYTVSVYAQTEAGNGNAASVGPVTPRRALAAPTAPRNVTVSAVPGVAGGVVTARWQASADDGDSAITAYTVTAEPGGATCETDGEGRSCDIENLDNGTAYRVSVVATNGVGDSAAGNSSRSATPAGVPGPPSLRTGRVSGSTWLVIFWDAPEDNGSPITEYRVVGEGGRSCTAYAPTRSCAIEGLEPATSYDFQVQAANEFGYGPLSAVQRLATLVAEADNDRQAPRQVTLTASNNGNMTARWLEPEDGPSLSGYVVWSAIIPATRLCETPNPPGMSETECIFEGALGSTYSVFVTAKVPDGQGGFRQGRPSRPSLPATAREAPTPPIGVAAVGGNRSVSISWNPPQFNGGAAITGYTARLQPGGATCTTDAETRSCLIEGLEPNALYQPYVAAVNAAGYSAYAPGQSARTTRDLPGAPTNVQATPAAFGSSYGATVSWAAPVDEGSEGPIAGYSVQAVYRNANGDSVYDNRLSCATQGQLSCTITGLLRGETYWVTVYAFTASGGRGAQTPQTAQFVAGAGNAVPPEPAVNVIAAAGFQEATVSWSLSPNDGGADVLRQLVQVVGGNQYLVGPDVTNYTVRGLQNGTAYTFVIKTVTLAGESASNPSNPVTPGRDPEPPPPPAALPGQPGTPVGVGADAAVELSWPPAATANADQVTGYRVQRRREGTNTWTDAFANSGSPLARVTVPGLTNGNRYEFRVAALNADGQGPWSDVSAAVMPSVAVATEPGRPVGSAGNGEVSLQWTVPASDGGRAITGYAVERSTDGQTWTLALADTGSDAVTVVVPGLTNGTAYLFRVAAINAAGRGPWSQGSAPLQPTAPAPPDPPGPPVPPLPPTPPVPPVGPPVAPGKPPPAEPPVPIVPEDPQPGRVATRPLAPVATALVRSAEVKWAKPDESGSGEISHYWVQAVPGGQGCEAPADGDLVCVVEDLTPGTAYTFTVEAINPVGFSLPSDPSNEVVPTEDKGTIEITGKRETKTIVVVRGASEGLAVGTKLTPRYKKTVGSQKGKWTRGTKVTLKRENGKFVFRVKLKAKQTLTLKVLAPGGVKSNTIKVSPR